MGANSAVKVLEVRNPAAVAASGPLRALLDRAAQAPEKAAYVAAHLGEPWLSVLVALDPTPVGLVVILWPSTPLTPSPQAGMLVANNARGRRALVEATVAAMRARGYTKGLVINNTGRADQTYLRALRKAGKPVKVASAFEFEFAPEPGGTGSRADG